MGRERIVAKTRRLVKAENGGFAGIDTSTAPTKLSPDTSQVSVNSDTSRPKLLQVRKGYARGTLAKLAYPARSALWWVARDGVSRFMYHEPGSGYLVGTDWPTELWPREPVVRGAGAATLFPPVTAQAVSDVRGLTLTWTNPVTPYLEGVRVQRREDRYPTHWTDGTQLLNAKLATVTDAALEVGETGYYAIWAYSRTRRSAPVFVSGTKVNFGNWDGSSATSTWKA